MRWLYKLEYKYGKYCIQNLMAYIVAGMAIVYMLDMMLYIDLPRLLYFDRALILQGQIWRIITFIFLPMTGRSGSDAFFLLISLYFYFMMGKLLEQYWGSFKLNVYYLVGIIGAIIAGFVSPLGVTNNIALNMSLFLAVAALMPDTPFMLFFILPIKAKWLALGYLLLMVPNIVNSFSMGASFGFNALIVLAFSLANYVLFFGRSLLETTQNQIRIWNNRRNWKNGNRR